KKYVTLILMLVILTGYVQAQTTLTGKVSEANGEALVGVSVYISGTSVGTVTDIDGTYTLNVPTGSETGMLTFSLIGYATQEVAINNRSDISIILLEDTKMLNEVVITGYTAQEKAKITGA